MGVVLLFYQYVNLPYPKKIRDEQEAFCKAHNLKGRILVATEGINGTLGGSTEATNQYIAWMKTQEFFATMPFKTSKGDQECFPKLAVKVKKEIVNFGLDTKEVHFSQASQHLSPEEFHQALATADQNTVVIDIRNECEARVGKFTGAIVPPVHRSREFPAYIDAQAEKLKDKKVLLYCTGGVRCERISAYFKKKGVENVYQLEGGIHEYVQKYPDGFFRGMNYVFDGRMGLKTNDDVLGTCDLCSTPCEEFNNCLNASCNKHFIGCQECITQYGNACSKNCHDLLQSGAVKPRPPLRKYRAIHAS